MAKFHVNGNGDAGECHAEKGGCPFGGATDHFTSKEAARESFEAKNQEEMTPKLSKKTAGAQVKNRFSSTPPKSAKEFRAEMAKIPDISESKVIKPGVASEGYMGGHRFIGAGAAATVNKTLSQTEAASGIRKLIQQAKEAGELPKWLSVSVTKNSGAWVSSISLSAGYKPEGSKKTRAIPDEWLYDDEDHGRAGRGLSPSKETEKAENYLQAASSYYESSDINSMVDYFNSYLAGRFRWRSSYEDSDS